MPLHRTKIPPHKVGNEMVFLSCAEDATLRDGTVNVVCLTTVILQKQWPEEYLIHRADKVGLLA